MADRWTPEEDWTEFQHAHNGQTEEQYEARAQAIREETAEMDAAFRAYMRSIPPGRPDPASYMSPDNPRRHWYE